MSINPQHHRLRRYALIIERVKGARVAPNNQQILEYLADNGCEIQERQLQRDRKDILNSFGVDIAYDFAKRGFVVQSSLAGVGDEQNLQGFLELLRLSNLMALVSEDYQTNKQTLDYVDFGQEEPFTGLHHLTTVLQAIKERKIISFDYTKFVHEEKQVVDNLHSQRVGQPYMLKSYLGRWYLVGRFYPKETKVSDDLASLVPEFRTFGLDRISDLKVYKLQYQRDDSIDAKQMFSEVVGLNYTEHDLETIVLSFTPNQANYVKSLPWHHSQTILLDDEYECRVEFQLRPNYEFKQQILKNIKHTTIIEPQWLREEIHQILSDSISRHDDESSVGL